MAIGEPNPIQEIAGEKCQGLVTIKQVDLVLCVEREQATVAGRIATSRARQNAGRPLDDTG